MNRKRLLPLLMCVLALTAPWTGFALNRAQMIAESEVYDGAWFYLDWFGFFRVDGDVLAEEGEILHNEHGWLYVRSTADADTWLVEDYSMGALLQISEADFPYYFIRVAPGDPRALGYLIGSAPAREFFNHVEAVTEVYPVAQYWTPDGPNGPVPAWWKERGLVDLTRASDHYAPALVGQLKHVATVAKDYLEERLPIDESDWDQAYALYGGQNPFPFTPTGDGSGFQIVNAGQLKFMSAPFYEQLAAYAPDYNVNEQLIALGVPAESLRSTSPFLPWPAASGSPNDLAVNTGQLKLAFSFDLEGRIGVPPAPARIFDSIQNQALALSWATKQEVSFQGVPSAVIPPLGPPMDGTPRWRWFFSASEHLDGAGFKWFKSGWFGWFTQVNDSYPGAADTSYPTHIDMGEAGAGWLYHLDHQWLYLDEINPDGNLYAYDAPTLGWWFTNRAWSQQGVPLKIGWIYSYSYKTWFYYGGTDDYQGRWFHSYMQTPSGYYNGWIWFANSGDSDNDGLSDFEEFKRQTDPSNPQSIVSGIDDGDWIAWYRGDSLSLQDGDIVTGWEDSAAENHLSRAVLSQAELIGPTFRTMESGVGAVTFHQTGVDGFNPILKNDNFAEKQAQFSATLETFSIAWVVKPYGLGSGTYTHISNDENQGWNNELNIHHIWDGSRRLGVFTNHDKRLSNSPVGTLELNRWHYFVFSFDAGTGRLFKNGRLIAEQADLPIPDSWPKLRLMDKAQAYLSELIVFDSALNAAQVSSLGHSINLRLNNILELRGEDRQLGAYGGTYDPISGSIDAQGISISIDAPAHGSTL